MITKPLKHRLLGRRATQARLYAVSLIASLAVVTGCSEQKVQATRKSASPQALPAEVTNVQRRNLSETLNVVGSVAARETAQVRAEIAGTVVEIVFDEGQTVKKGQLLAKIDDSEISAQTDEAAAAFRLAELNLARAENLAKTNTVTLADRDRAEAEYRGAKAKLALQRSRLAKTEVRAPFDGVVGARTLSPGDYVNNQTVITKVDDIGRLKIDFEVPERFVRLVAPGTTFSLRRTGGAPVKGEVFFVSAAVSRETRSSTVKGYLVTPPAELKPGMFANVEIVLAEHKGVLVVPESAVLVSGTGTQIVIARKSGEERVADFVAVQLGLRSKGFVEVSPVQGVIEENEPVVASGVGAITLFQDAKLVVKPLRKELLVPAEE